MSYKIWGNTIWYLFHGMAEKLKPEYDEFAIEIVHMINKICIILPCEDCSNHAKKTLKKCNLKSINTREKLKDFVWKFHNIVNEKLNKELVSKETRDELYKNIKLSNIIYNFKLIMNRRTKLMFGTLYKQHIMEEFNTFYNNNSIKFEI